MTGKFCRVCGRKMRKTAGDIGPKCMLKLKRKNEKRMEYNKIRDLFSENVWISKQ